VGALGYRWASQSRYRTTSGGTGTARNELTSSESGSTVPRVDCAVLSIMQIRPYATADHEICLKIFRSNVPAYFAASDEPEFERFLDGQIGPLWVAVNNGGILACGGVALDYPEAGIATLCWGMVAADKHRHGIGSR
jgi:hypothetical protein